MSNRFSFLRGDAAMVDYASSIRAHSGVERDGSGKAWGRVSTLTQVNTLSMVFQHSGALPTTTLLHVQRRANQKSAITLNGYAAGPSDRTPNSEQRT